MKKSECDLEPPFSPESAMKLRWTLGLLLAVGLCLFVQPARADDALPLQNSVSQYGITWTFDKTTPVGQFITGDYYVVGAVTITTIDPAPKPGRNGSMLNP